MVSVCFCTSGCPSESHMTPKADRCWGELHCLKDWGNGKYGQMVPGLKKMESPCNVCGVPAAGVVGRAAPAGWTLVSKP